MENCKNISNQTQNQNGSVVNDLNAVMLVAIVGCFCICLWVIILNGLFVLCFWINRHKTWFTRSKNILSIIIIDFLVGVTILMALISSAKTNVSSHECILSMCLCVASQTATLFNVLRFCIIRFYTIRSSVVKQEPSTKTVLLQTLLIWTLSSIIIVGPLIFWSDLPSVIDRCTWDKLFTTNGRKVDLYILHVLTLPALAMSVLYGVMTLHLKRVKRLIHPNSNTLESSNQNLSSNKISQLREDNSIGMVKMSTDRHISNNTCRLNSVLDRITKGAIRQDCLQVNDGKLDTADQKYTRTALHSVHTQTEERFRTTQDSLHCAVSTTSKEHFPKLDRRDSVQNSKTTVSVRKNISPNSAATSSFMSDTQGNTDKLEHGDNANAASVDNREGYKFGSSTFNRHQNIILVDSAKSTCRQKQLAQTQNNVHLRTGSVFNLRRSKQMAKVITTIGIILLLINVSILPYVVLLIVKLASPDYKIPSMFGFLSLFFLLLNSATNPIIYAVRLQPLRVAFVNMYESCCCFLCGKLFKT